MVCLLSSVPWHLPLICLVHVVVARTKDIIHLGRLISRQSSSPGAGSSRVALSASAVAARNHIIPPQCRHIALSLDSSSR
ncbi:hypothetical protein V1505DRAFT_362558, partial [Lipomyces doorenjongii]